MGTSLGSSHIQLLLGHVWSYAFHYCFFLEISVSKTVAMLVVLTNVCGVHFPIHYSAS
jgi:hypothetical protein